MGLKMFVEIFGNYKLNWVFITVIVLHIYFIPRIGSVFLLKCLKVQDFVCNLTLCEQITHILGFLLFPDYYFSCMCIPF